VCGRNHQQQQKVVEVFPTHTSLRTRFLPSTPCTPPPPHTHTRALTQVGVTDNQDLKAGYTIVMTFSDMNPFFSNR
jgi:hypothetical protein